MGGRDWLGIPSGARAGCRGSRARPKAIQVNAVDSHSPALVYRWSISYDCGLMLVPGWSCVMKVLSSLKSAKARHRDCKIVRRRGKVFVICKSNPRFKARQR